MRERVIEKHLRLGVEERGGICYKFVSPGRNSVPDRLVAIPWYHLHLVETKAPDGRLSDGQMREHKRLREMGYTVYVLWTIDLVNKHLQDIDYALS